MGVPITAPGNTENISDAIAEAFANYGGNDFVLGKEEGVYFAEYMPDARGRVYRRNILVVAGPRYKVKE